MPLANTDETANSVLRRVRDAATIVYDAETSGLSPYKNYAIGHVLSFSERPEDSFYVPIRHAGGGNLPGERLPDGPEGEWWPHPFEIKLWQALRGKRIVGHNLMFDLGFMGIDSTQIGRCEDTMIMAYLVDELRKDFSLEICCETEKVTPKKGTDLYLHMAKTLGVEPKRDKAMGDYWRTNAADEVVWDYAVGDGVSTWNLWQALHKKIAEQKLEQVFNIECKLQPILHRMRMRGIKVDMERLDHVITTTEQSLVDALAAVGGINVKSRKQVREMLEEADAKGWPITDKGNASFPEKWLKTNPAGLAILAVRKQRTLLEHFLTPLVESHLVGDRVHSEFHQVRDGKYGTVTGRISTSRPNLSALPGKERQGDLGGFFRGIFRPDYGQWVDADFKAAEIRIAAHYARAPLWLNAFRDGVDPHKMVADSLGISRQQAKSISLGLIMGMGARRCAAELGLGEQEGRSVVRKYFQGLPELKRLQDDARAAYEKRGYVRTISGRRLRLEAPQFSFRATNRLTQGGCADLLKSRLIEMDEVARSYDETALLLSIYDSISWQTTSAKADNELRRVMVGDNASMIQFLVPQEIEVKSGPSWGEVSA